MKSMLRKIISGGGWDIFNNDNINFNKDGGIGNLSLSTKDDFELEQNSQNVSLNAVGGVEETSVSESFSEVTFSLDNQNVSLTAEE